uniref:Uncharacterized protein n=1 Tax=Ovis aries TaxID=9940 RepID=A0AC11E956_SHEEP
GEQTAPQAAPSLHPPLPFLSRPFSSPPPPPRPAPSRPFPPLSSEGTFRRPIHQPESGPRCCGLGAEPGGQAGGRPGPDGAGAAGPRVSAAAGRAGAGQQGSGTLTADRGAAPPEKHGCPSKGHGVAQQQPGGLRAHPRSTLEAEEDEEDDDDEEDTVTRLGPDDTLPGPELSAEPDGPLSVNVFTSAEELERAQRLEERERILREIWRTGQPDLLGTGTLGPSPTSTGTLGRMHYY